MSRSIWALKKIIALTFIPVLDVIKAFDLFADNFLGDFENTWIGEPKKRGKSIHQWVLNISYETNTIPNWTVECL